MVSRPRALFGFMIAISVVAWTHPAQADFKSLLGRVPGDANTVVLIDVEKMLGSPLGIREGWKAKMANAYASKPLVVPPNANRVIMAAWIDPGNLETIWEVSVMDLAKAPSLDSIARLEGGYLDKFASIPAVWSPINAYFIQFEAQVLGAASPANRQFASRWAAGKLVTSGKALSAYLSGAAGTVSAETPIVMAMDLQDVTCATKVRRRLATETFDSLEGKKLDLDALSELFGGIRGVTLRISIGEEAGGKGVVDFGSDTAILAGVAKPLLLELLSQAGAMVDDFATWQVATKGKQVTFEGKLSTNGLRRLLCVVEPPSPEESESADADKTGDDAKAAASKQYFKTVQDIVQKLDQRAHGGQGGTLNEIAAWIKRDANAIDRLSIRNVDPDLVTFGAEISTRLNEAARVLTAGAMLAQARTAGIQRQAGDIKQRDAAIAQAYAQRRQALHEEKAKAVGQVIEAFKGLKAKAENVRLEMTNRYKVEF